jgi:hypothetical protein
MVAMKTALISGKVLVLSMLESRDLVITGVLAAAVWYLMGAEDRYRMRLYRSQVEKATRELPDEAWSINSHRSREVRKS